MDNTIAINIIGRLGNQIFQYAFARIYALKQALEIETTQWAGKQLFGHNDPSPRPNRIPVTDIGTKIDTSIWNTDLRGCIITGYFQYHTSFYAKNKNLFQSLFNPIGMTKSTVEKLFAGFGGRPIISIHLRRGDFVDHPLYFVAPSQWYKDWLATFWKSLPDPILYIASDEPRKVKADFSEYSPVTSADIGFSQEPYMDFYIMTQSNYLAISDSTYSFAASMLNNKSSMFMRPHNNKSKLISYDPWNDEVQYGPNHI